MTPITIIRSPAIPMPMDNIDTDQVFPARFSSRDRRDGRFGDYFFHDRRFDEQERPIPEFVMNDPRLAGAQIIVAGANYGSGSGRPGAIFSHVDFGIRVVIAQSFGPVFAAAAYKAGLLTIEIDHDPLVALRDSVERCPGAPLTVDLDTQQIVPADGREMPFVVDPFVRRVLRSGQDEIDLTLGHRVQVEAFEARQRVRMPWLFARPA